MRYIGADIVPDLIAALRAKYGDRAGHHFCIIDIAHDVLPSVGLCLCHVVLAHLTNVDGLAVLRNFVASDIPYLLTKTYDFVTVNLIRGWGDFATLTCVARHLGWENRGCESGM